MTRSLATALALALILPATAPVALARDITGQLAYRERIALDPGALMLVELRGPGDVVVAEARLPTNGAQVPLPFTLTAPDTGDYRLQGALLVGGRQVWLSPVVAVAAGGGALDAGTLALTAGAGIGFATRMDCGDTRIEIGFSGEAARLRLGDEVFDLAPVPSGSGTRHSDGASPETAIHGKGNAAIVTLRGDDLPECAPVITPALLPMTARGNEPFWSLEVTDAGYVHTTNMGADRAEGPLPQAVAVPGGMRFEVSPDLAFTVERGLCRDSMAGMPFPLTVTLTDRGQTLTGCGGAAADLLDGAWTVAEVAGTALPEDAGVTLVVDGPAGRVFGKGGCNSYNAGFTLTGEGLSFSPAASTMMACPEDQMAREQAFHQALASVDGFDIGAGGALELRSAGAVVIRAGR
jgi:heat shock protein HslJ/uncharacterized lipoprotein YbaY